uniref:Truncated S-locus cysteine-rich-like protein n=1 Tax=Leavenworthia alabamica TaxID=310722 RepID=R9SA73_LEAAL|nr:truncated S-locus cysteine-rich-like protein [Leavenworthia alabamica]
MAKQVSLVNFISYLMITMLISAAKKPHSLAVPLIVDRDKNNGCFGVPSKKNNLYSMQKTNG